MKNNLTTRTNKGYQAILRTYKAYPFRVDFVKYMTETFVIKYRVVYRIAETATDYYTEVTKFEDYMCALAFFEDKVDYIDSALS